MKLKFKILIVFFIINVNLFGQNVSNTVKFETVKPIGKIRIDTIDKVMNLKKIDKNNFQIIYTSYFETTKYQREFKFQTGESPNAYRIKCEFDNELLVDSVRLNFIDKLEIKLYDLDYTIFKFFYNLDYGVDEELLIFFVPEYGIIMEKPISWPGYTKLIDSENSENKKILEKFNEIILYNSGFFRDYTKTN